MTQGNRPQGDSPRPLGDHQRQSPLGDCPCPRRASSYRAEMEASILSDLVIITGFSGAGKSTAMAAFEDEGYFCVDNLPSEMIRTLIELFMHAGSKVARAAVVSGARGGSY